MDPMLKLLLTQVADLLGRADCALLPDMEDCPTARDECRQAAKLLEDIQLIFD